MSVRKGGREGRLLMFCAQRRINQPLQHSAICLEVFGLQPRTSLASYKHLYAQSPHVSLLYTRLIMDQSKGSDF